jgi:type I restriction enzyme, S subunit
MINIELGNTMKAGWKKTTLGEVCILKSGTTVEKNLEKAFGDLPYLKVADMTLPENLDEIVTSSRFLEEKSLRNNSIFPIGTTIFPKRGGAIMTNKKRLTSVPICTDLNIMGVIPTSVLFPRFLYYYFLNVDMRKLGSGSSIPQINNYDIEPLFISFPLIPEQKRIVAIVDEAFEAIDIAIDNTKQNLTNARELFDSYLNAIFTQKGDGWEETNLGKICDVRDGTHDSPKYVNDGIPFITQKNIRDDGLTFDNVKFISDDDHKKFYARSNVTFGDILISMIGVNRGMTCVVDDNRIFSIKNVGLIKSSKNIDKYFLLYFLKSNKAQAYIESVSRGGAQPFVGLGKLREFPVSIAPPNKQANIVIELDELYSETQRLETIYRQKLTALNELKQSILHKAFTGELTADKADLKTNIEREAIAV